MPRPLCAQAIAAAKSLKAKRRPAIGNEPALARPGDQLLHVGIGLLAFEQRELADIDADSRPRPSSAED